MNPDHSLPERAVRWKFNNLDTNRNKVNTLLFSAEFHYALNPVRVLPSFHSVTSLSTIICITILLIQTTVIILVRFKLQRCYKQSTETVYGALMTTVHGLLVS